MERLTVSKKEAAVMAGVSEATIHRLIKKKQIPVKHFGRRILISKQVLINFINSEKETEDKEHDLWRDE